jgi:RimJ/RimL family protein N-acetyltransferase
MPGDGAAGDVPPGHDPPGDAPPGDAHDYPMVLDTPIRTERLLLRPWRPGDDGDRSMYQVLMGDPEVVRYHYVDVLQPEEAEERLASRDAVISGPGGWMNLAVELSGTGMLVGDVGLSWLGDHHRQAEIGYSFLPAHHGHGYATEAAAAMVDLAFTGLGAHRVAGRLDGRNMASERVLQRLGMRREAHLVENEWVKGEWCDEVIYAMTDREWSELNRSGDAPGHRGPPD